MKGRTYRTVVVIAGLVALTTAACATSKQSASWSGDPVADRQRLMKLHGALWKDIQDKQKAGNIEGIVPDAEALALNATRIPALFGPEKTTNEKSNAKPEVWQKWPEFEKAAQNLQTQSEKLRDVAKTKDADATGTVIKDFGKNACGTCHTPFRVPPKQQG
jgi:cytochrome c556